MLKGVEEVSNLSGGSLLEKIVWFMPQVGQKYYCSIIGWQVLFSSLGTPVRWALIGLSLQMPCSL